MPGIADDRQKCSPCVSSQSKRQVVRRCRDNLVSTSHSIAFTLPELRKPKSIKFVGVFIDSFVCVSGAGWDGNVGACGNRHAIRKCEWAQHETGHDNWVKEHW